MALEPGYARILENVLRALSTAARSLRLYPTTSPIPRQTVDAAIAALGEYFALGPTELRLAVAREGFAFKGESVATNPVSLELANTLRDHGVAQVDIIPGATPEDLLGFLSVVSRPAEEVRAEGGISSVVANLGVYSVSLTDVQLVAVEQSADSSANSDERLLEIADSPAKLIAWFASAAADKDTLRANIRQFSEVTGEEGTENLADALSESLAGQPAENRDALFSLALDPGVARQLASQMFATMDAGDIASSLLGGTFGSNMLSLSSALSNLPLDDISSSVRREVLEMLPDTGHSPEEASFLAHMLDIRDNAMAEPALAEADRSFRTIVQAGSVSDSDVARALAVTTAATGVLDDVGVRTMLTLLDQQTDCERFCSAADGVAAMVPRLLERGKVDLASRVLDELIAREAHHPEWPELQARLRLALSSAVSPEGAAALVRACAEDRELLPKARAILRFSGDSLQTAIATEAITLKSDGLDVADELLGKRLIDLLYGLAPTAQWFQLEPVVERLAAEGSPRSLQTIEALLARPEEQARREIVNALASVNEVALLPLLGAALNDPSEEVAAIAARAIAKSGLPGSAAVLANQLGEIDMDNADFTRARELIGALARTADPAADEALKHLASRRALIKRGHFAEVQQLVAQAVAVRKRGGVA